MYQKKNFVSARILLERLRQKLLTMEGFCDFIDLNIYQLSFEEIKCRSQTKEMLNAIKWLHKLREWLTQYIKSLEQLKSIQSEDIFVLSRHLVGKKFIKISYPDSRRVQHINVYLEKIMEYKNVINCYYEHSLGHLFDSSDQPPDSNKTFLDWYRNRTFTAGKDKHGFCVYLEQRGALELINAKDEKSKNEKIILLKGYFKENGIINDWFQSWLTHHANQDGVGGFETLFVICILSFTNFFIKVSDKTTLNVDEKFLASDGVVVLCVNKKIVLDVCTPRDFGKGLTPFKFELLLQSEMRLKNYVPIYTQGEFDINVTDNRRNNSNFPKAAYDAMLNDLLECIYFFIDFSGTFQELKANFEQDSWITMKKNQLNLSNYQFTTESMENAGAISLPFSPIEQPVIFMAPDSDQQTRFRSRSFDSYFGCTRHKLLEP